MASGPLFRTEVLARRDERLQGSVNLAVPVAWQLLGLLLFAAVALALIVLSVGSYARTETASGVVSLDTGVVTIIPSRAGIITHVAVREGQAVTRGQPLLAVKTEEALEGDRTAPTRTREALRQQDDQLAAQVRHTIQAAEADRARIREQIAGAGAELRQLRSQIEDQKRLIGQAEADFERAKSIAANGFVSKRDLDARESILISRHQQLAQLEQAAYAKRSSIDEASRSLTQASAAAEVQVASTQASRAALEQQLAQADLASGYIISSPVAGRVTGLDARVGQPAATDHQSMMIVPGSSKLQAELYLPTAAAAFVQDGQEVRLAVDAFPYSTYGTMQARVTSVSGAAVVRTDNKGATPVYIVTAEIAHPWMQVYGRRHRLVPGMTLSGRIVTERRSLFRWLFEPIFAVKNR